MEDFEIVFHLVVGGLVLFCLLLCSIGNWRFWDRKGFRWIIIAMVAITVLSIVALGIFDVVSFVWRLFA